MRAKDLFEKSTSQAQFRTMAAAANNPKFAKKVGISQDVAREFHAADRKSDYKKLPDHANESQLNEAEDLLSMLQDYISSHYTADQGYGEGVVEKAEADMEMIEAKITEIKGASYFEDLKEFAELVTYDAEYADSEESAKIQPQLEKLAQKLGYTVDQLREI